MGCETIDGDIWTDGGAIVQLPSKTDPDMAKGTGDSVHISFYGFDFYGKIIDPYNEKARPASAGLFRVLVECTHANYISRARLI